MRNKWLLTVLMTVITIGGLKAQKSMYSSVSLTIATPGATTPFGMVQVGPDNGIKGWEFCSGYHNQSKTIMGFSHTHLSGTGATEMGDIMLIPVVVKVPFSAGEEENPSSGYRSSFSHDSEQASPGYYRVKLDDYNIFAEMIAIPRVGLHRYTYLTNEKSASMILYDNAMAIFNLKSKYK